MLTLACFIVKRAPAIDSGAPVDPLARGSPAVAVAHVHPLADNIEDGSLDAADEWGVRYGGWGWGCTLFDYDNDADLDFAMVLLSFDVIFWTISFPKESRRHTIPHACVMYSTLPMVIRC